jgi:hypothetical protein
MPAAAMFELADGVAEPDNDPLGLWWSPPAAPASQHALNTVTGSEYTVWRVRLPADTGAANTLLTRVETSLVESRLALGAVEGRVRAFLAVHAATPFAGSPMLAARGHTELQLDRLLAEPLGAWAGEVGFAPSRLSRLWEQVASQTDAFLALLDEATAAHSRVESERDGRVVACTELAWRGGTQTVWRAGSGDDWSDFHQRAVALVYESRLALVRTFATAINAAVLLVTLFTPGGALLAFPAALRFVAHILAEARTRD